MALGTLVDSNVLLDVITDDPRFAASAADALAGAAERGPLYINTVIYAEVSVRFSRVEELDAVLPVNDYRRLDIPWPAAFLAAKAFVDYRRRGGVRSSTMPDFFIGAHAAVSDLPLLTRDPRRYRTYFPTVRLISSPG